MNCQCGHHASLHGNTGWPKFLPCCDGFVCCTARRDPSPGRSGGEHDFATHRPQPCPCGGYTEEQP